MSIQSFGIFRNVLTIFAHAYYDITLTNSHNISLVSYYGHHVIYFWPLPYYIVVVITLTEISTVHSNGGRDSNVLKGR